MEPKASKLLVSVTIILVFLAIILGIYLRNQIPQVPLDKYALSAITRAKSLPCKEELKTFALATAWSASIKKRLKRRCKLDSNQQGFERVGCADNKSNNIVKIEKYVDDTTSCLDLCFSYGHKYGGFDLISGHCYCGDEILRAGCGNSKFFWYKVNRGSYFPSVFNTPDAASNNDSLVSIKIAFVLVFRGKGLRQIRRLLENIYSPSHIYYIHVDGRDQYLFNSLYYLYKERGNFIFAANRLNTIWGGTSLLQMYLNAIKQLHRYQWDFLVNLSESDYPVKSLGRLESYLAKSTDRIFLKLHNIKGYKYIKKQGLERNFYQCDDHLWHMGTRNLPVGIVYSGGSDWFALPRKFCLYIAQEEMNSNGLVEPLIEIFNHTLLPAESFFHTLALNSEFCDKFFDNNLRLTNWDRKRGCKCQHKDVVDWCGCSPLNYRKSDWTRLRMTINSPNIFFSRKFDPTISSSILGMVDRFLLNKTSIDNDTRFWLPLWRQRRDDNFPTSIGVVLKQLVVHALAQIDYPRQDFSDISADQYFSQDRFIGLVFSCCFGALKSDCIQFLLERRLESHLSDFDPTCFRSNEADLKIIEVNHGFDTGERMFRRFDPLSVNSDVVVYHEWFLRNVTISLSNASNHLNFNWINPKGALESIQRLELKRSRQSKLSLAHKLNVHKPMEPGLWRLAIARGSQRCLEYKFVMFDEKPNETKAISQEEFDNFFNVTRRCFSEKTCKNQGWSLNSLVDTIN